MTSVGICSVSIGISIRTTDEFGSVGRIDVVDWRPEWPENFNRECIRLAAFEAVGNMYVPEHEDRMPERRYFQVGSSCQPCPDSPPIVFIIATVVVAVLIIAAVHKATDVVIDDETATDDVEKEEDGEGDGKKT